MRQLQKRKGRKPRKKAEPLAEGIIPLKKNGKRDWQSMSGGDIVAYAQRVMSENGIYGRKELKKADGGLYSVLGRRKLLHRIGFEQKLRDWKSMTDEEIVEHARRVTSENELKGRDELYKADGGLYQVLRTRKLLDKIDFEERRRPNGFFTRMSDEELVEYARGVVDEKSLKKKTDVKVVDSGLYQVLCKRKLLDRIGLGGYSSWASMNDSVLVRYGRRAVREKGLTSRIGLMKADNALYQVLKKRKLLDAVFAPLESEQKREAVRQVVDAMKEFDA